MMKESTLKSSRPAIHPSIYLFIYLYSSTTCGRLEVLLQKVYMYSFTWQVAQEAAHRSFAKAQVMHMGVRDGLGNLIKAENRRF